MSVENIANEVLSSSRGYHVIAISTLTQRAVGKITKEKLQRASADVLEKTVEG